MDRHMRLYKCTVEELESYQGLRSKPYKGYNKPQGRTIDFDKRIDFGKYKGQTGLEIAQHDVKYLVWANEQENITLTTELLIIVGVQVKAINERDEDDDR